MLHDIDEMTNSWEIQHNRKNREELVPMRFDIDLNGSRFRDSILWNIYETSITPEMFAKRTVQDSRLHVVFEVVL